MKYIALTFTLLFSLKASADWRSGKIEMIAIGYDGKTISIGHENANKSGCTCYATWPNRYCLDRTRESFQQEYALLLSAKAKNKSVAINIDETTCKVRAIYEN